MSDIFRIIHPHIENHKIFKVLVDTKNISDLFDLQIKKVEPIKEGNGDGVYSIHYKEKLIYIGRHNTEKCSRKMGKAPKNSNGKIFAHQFLELIKKKTR